MTHALSLPATPDGGMATYLAAIRRIPILAADEEYMLAKRWREHEDVAAAQKLVLSHLRLAAKMAMRYRHYGLPIADLVSEGNVGLMRAVKKFDPDVGVRLSTYAMWWIKAALHEYLLNSWSLVKIGTMAAQRKLFFNLRRIKAKLGILDSSELSPAQARAIAAELNVGAGDVMMMSNRLSSRDTSLNAPVAADADVEMQDLLIDGADNQEAVLGERQEWQLRRLALADGLKVLNERERHIVSERHLRDEPATLEELGRHYGISRERVRQIEARALSKLQEAVRAAVAA